MKTANDGKDSSGMISDFCTDLWTGNVDKFVTGNRD